MKINNFMKKYKENKKAFTLVELMGVLVIIGALSAILIPVISKTLKENKEKVYQVQLQNIILASKNFGSDNPFILPVEKNEVIYVTLGQLISKGYIEPEIINPLTNEEFSKCLIIEIRKLDQGYNYAVDESSLTIKECNIGNSEILITGPTNKYIKDKMTSKYIITIGSENPEDTLTKYDYDIDNSKIGLTGTAHEDAKYSIEGSLGVYTLTIEGGATEGELGFVLNPGSIKDEYGNNVIGNTAKAPSENIIVDNTAPECGEWKGQGTTWSNTRTITMTGIDSGVGVDDSKSFKKTYNIGEITTDSLSHTVEDKLGNSRTCSIASANIYVDAVAPTIVVKAYENNNGVAKGSVLANKTNDNIEITDWKNYEYYFDFAGSSDSASGIKSEKWEWNTTGKKDLDTGIAATENHNGIVNKILSSEGNRYGRLTLTDNVGNSRTVTVNVKIDKSGPSAPSLILTHSRDASKADGSQATVYTNNTWTNKEIYLTDARKTPFNGPSSTDNFSGVKEYQISKDNKNWTTYNYVYANDIYVIKTEGTAFRYLRAIDNAGNISSVTTKTIKIDRTQPTIAYSGTCSFTGTTIKRCDKFTLNDNSGDSINLYRSHCSLASETIHANYCEWRSARFRVQSFFQNKTFFTDGNITDNKTVWHGGKDNATFFNQYGDKVAQPAIASGTTMQLNALMDGTIEYAFIACDKAGNCTPRTPQTSICYIRVGTDSKATNKLECGS